MIKEIDLESFIIESNVFRYNPSTAAVLCTRFGLNWKRITLGWIKIEHEMDQRKAEAKR